MHATDLPGRESKVRRRYLAQPTAEMRLTLNIPGGSRVKREGETRVRENTGRSKFDYLIRTDNRETVGYPKLLEYQPPLVLFRSYRRNENSFRLSRTQSKSLELRNAISSGIRARVIPRQIRIEDRVPESTRSTRAPLTASVAHYYCIR